MNSDYKLIDDILTIGQHFTLNRTSEVQAPGGIIETALDIPSAIPVYASDGSWGGPVGGWPDRRNPRAVLEYNKDNRYTYWRMFGDAYVNLTPFKGFNLRSTFGLDYANKQARYFTYPYQEGTQTNNGKERSGSQAGTLDEMDVERHCYLPTGSRQTSWRCNDRYGVEP